VVGGGEQEGGGAESTVLFLESTGLLLEAPVLLLEFLEALELPKDLLPLLAVQDERVGVGQEMKAEIPRDQGALGHLGIVPRIYNLGTRRKRSLAHARMP
jgi:hypothetical protein